MIRFERKWAMPSKNTFSIKPIKELIEEELREVYEKENYEIVDPFANESSYGTLTNDLNPRYNTTYHLDALTFLKQIESSSVDCCLYDPPYSVRQVKEVYDSIGKAITTESRSDYWGACKKEVSRIVKVGGKVISFCWNSGGIGKNLGMEIERILLVPQGGIHNDTIVTVEKKIKGSIELL